MLLAQTPNWVRDQFSGIIFDPQKLDVQDCPIYDTVTLASGQQVSSNSASFFTNVKSSSGKTLADTNLQRDSELPDPQMFAVKAISLHFDEDISAADLKQIMRKFAFQLVVGTKTLVEGPVYRFAAAGGIAAVSTLTSSQWLQNGSPDRANLCTLACPIVIPPGVNFYAQLSGNTYTLTGTDGLRLQCVLSGLFAKGVQ